MAKSSWMTVRADDLGIDTRDAAEKERDRLAGLARVEMIMSRRRGKQPDYDLMCDRVFGKIVPELQEQHQMILFKESEIERLTKELEAKRATS